MLGKIVLTSFLVLGAPCAVAITCPPMPERIAQTSRDLKVDIDFAAGVLGRLRAAELAVRADSVTRDLFAKHPSTEKLWILQTMASTYCSILASDGGSSNADKAERWRIFTDRTFVAFGFTSAASTPKANPPASAQSGRQRQSQSSAPPQGSQSASASGGSTAVNASGSAQVRIGIKE